VLLGASGALLPSCSLRMSGRAREGKQEHSFRPFHGLLLRHSSSEQPSAQQRSGPGSKPPPRRAPTCGLLSGLLLLRAARWTQLSQVTVQGPRPGELAKGSP
jgi:hypothetical protein